MRSVEGVDVISLTDGVSRDHASTGSGSGYLSRQTQCGRTHLGGPIGGSSWGAYQECLTR